MRKLFTIFILTIFAIPSQAGELGEVLGSLLIGGATGYALANHVNRPRYPQTYEIVNGQPPQLYMNPNYTFGGMPRGMYATSNMTVPVPPQVVYVPVPTRQCNFEPLFDANGRQVSQRQVCY